MIYSKTKGVFALLVGVTTPFILIVGMFIYSAFHEPWFVPEVPAAGVVVAEQESSDGDFLSQVIATDERGVYRFIVFNILTEQAINEKTISVPVSYHAHGVSIEWNQKTNEVIATIDHDYGEGNIDISLHY